MEDSLLEFSDPDFSSRELKCNSSLNMEFMSAEPWSFSARFALVFSWIFSNNQSSQLNFPSWVPESSWSEILHWILSQSRDSTLQDRSGWKWLSAASACFTLISHKFSLIVSIPKSGLNSFLTKVWKYKFLAYVIWVVIVHSWKSPLAPWPIS